MSHDAQNLRELSSSYPLQLSVVGRPLAGQGQARPSEGRVPTYPERGASIIIASDG
ncbi:MAG TPA: hypothetical protein VG713_00245 [Pirellulales bacterium]|nr:hypothetical protein [Pirellulales bacterium]